MKVFIDTGAFLALADKADTFHKTTTDVFQDVVQQKALLYTSNYIIDETITLIRAKVGHKAAVLFIKGIGASNIKELRVSEEDEGASKEIFIKYKDKAFSFTDCTSFALIDRHSIGAVLSLDEHFCRYGFRHGVKHLLMK